MRHLRILLLIITCTAAYASEFAPNRIMAPTVGPIISLPAPDTMRFWLRGPVDPEAGKTFSGVVSYRPQDSTDWTQILFPLSVLFNQDGIKDRQDFTGFGEARLVPGTYDYRCGYYENGGDGEIAWAPDSEVYRFTLRDRTVNGTALAFGSCRYFVTTKLVNLWVDKSDRIFGRMLERHAGENPIDAFASIGDMIYADPFGGFWPGMLACNNYSQFMQLYEYSLGTPNMKRLLATVPTLLMGDDHEIRNDVIVEGHEDLGYVKAGLAAYGTYMYATTPGFTRHPADPKGGYSFNVRGIPGYMLDTRYNRTAEPKRLISDGDMASMKAWLLTNIEAPYKLVFSTVPMFPGFANNLAEDGDKWRGHLDQTMELLNFIDDHRIRGVIVASGDIHISCYAQIRTPGGIKLTSVVASPFFWSLLHQVGDLYRLDTEAGRTEFLPGYPYVSASIAYPTDVYARLDFMGNNQLGVKLLSKDEGVEWLNARDPAGWVLDL